MADRRRVVSAETDEPKKSRTNLALERFRSNLRIEKDDLDNCLVEQPELYDHVGEALSLAIAERDSTKLDLEEAEAEEGQKIRSRAAQMDEKLTEASVREQLTLNSRLMKLRRLQLEQKALVDAWSVLKESFQQRSYMLRELAPVHIARLFGSGNSVRVDAKNAVADTARDRIGEERARRGFKRGE